MLVLSIFQIFSPPPCPPLSSPSLPLPPHHPPPPALCLPPAQTMTGVHLDHPPTIHVHCFSIFNVFDMHSPLHFIHTVHCTVHTKLNKKYGIHLQLEMPFAVVSCFGCL